MRRAPASQSSGRAPSGRRFGVAQIEQVGRYCASSAVVPAIVWFPAETQPDGWVRLRGEARLVLATGPAADLFAELLRGAGCTVDLDADFTTAAWRKLLVNALAGLMVLTGRSSGMFRRDDVAALARRYLTECLAVARAEGANLGEEVIDEIVDLFARASAVMGTSIRADPSTWPSHLSTCSRCSPTPTPGRGGRK